MSKLVLSLSLKQMFIIKHSLQKSIKVKKDTLTHALTFGGEDEDTLSEFEQEIIEDEHFLKDITARIDDFKAKKNIK